MPDLSETAGQFARDLVAMNVAGLMMAFTPEGMTKALVMQAQVQANGPQPPSTGAEVTMAGAEGEDQLVDIVVTNANGSATIFTRWTEIAGAWKVADIGIRPSAPAS